MKAIWNGTVIAESEHTVVVEDNHYFPAASVKLDYLRPSATETMCHWKGKASYYDLIVQGKTNPDAAWYYLEPNDAARQISGHIAFWKGVQVTR